ncbi:MAG: hypothetical protein HC880_16740 [Bacteroidia bacterium]|nr:hypothetical protein [Bacteroidia bacterium]
MIFLFYPEYSLEDTTVDAGSDTMRYEEFSVISSQNRFKPGLFSRSIFLEEGETYSQTDHRLSLSRLASAGAFKFVNIRFEDDSTQAGRLPTRVYLTPLPRRSVQAEIQATTQSNGFAGPQVQLNFTNRNVFGAAENLTLQLEAGYQQQFGGQRSIDYIWWFGIGADLAFPYFLLPFNLKNQYNEFTPYTRIKPFYRRTIFNPLLKTHNIQLDFGYEWQETLRKQHRLYPISVIYQRSDISDVEVGESLREGIIRQSLDDQFILEANYEFTYNALRPGEGPNGFYFRGTTDVAGNTLSLLQNIFGPDETPRTILGIRYAQYARFGAEFRYHRRLGPRSMLASRLLGNLGIPYGNSDALPFLSNTL